MGNVPCSPVRCAQGDDGEIPQSQILRKALRTGKLINEASTLRHNFTHNIYVLGKGRDALRHLF